MPPGSLAALAVAMLYPNLELAHWGGLVLFVAIFVWDRRRHRRQKARVTTKMKV